MQNRKCSKCGQCKPTKEFFKDICKKCYFKDRVISKRHHNLERVYNYLLVHPCVDCGESNPIILEFDHINGNKSFTIGSHLHYDWGKIEREINKCEVRCANCHKLRHARKENWGIVRLVEGTKESP